MTAYAHIGEGDLVADVMSHPAFGGRGRLLFPWDEQSRYAPNMTMRDVPQLNIWHTNQSPAEMVAGVNRLIDDRSRGLQVLYSMYDAGAVAEDPTKADTGLFFLRGEPGAPFAVVCAGGGYRYVASLHEGLPVAMQVNEAGYNAFVLKYRPSCGRRAMTEDLVSAVEFVVGHADALAVAREGYSLWGGSAGARLCAYATYGAGRFAPAGRGLHPAANVIAYTYLDFDARFGPDGPAGYFITGAEDWIVPVESTAKDARALAAAGVDALVRTPPGVGHGFGTGRGTSADGWVRDAVSFWEAHMGKEAR